jgi:hypothetical protein
VFSRLGLRFALAAAAVALGSAAACDDEADAPREPDPPRFSAEQCAEMDPGDLFAKRIEPLLLEDRPSSCSQCHLAGIDLAAFMRDDPCESLACLKKQKLVNFDHPKQSLILSWIERAEPSSSLVTVEVIDEEYEGFLEWIEFGASCSEQVCKDVKCTTPDEAAPCLTREPDEAKTEAIAKRPLDCSDLELERLFRDTVYGVRGRCSPCHVDVSAPKIEGSPPGWISTDGTCNTASLKTMREVERLGYLNVDEPDQSLLLLKPLAEDEGGVEHGGGDKFHGTDDPGWINLNTFVERYAACFGSE